MEIPAPGPVVQLRAATMADARRLFDWRNDPDARAMSFSTSEISFENHLVWLSDLLADPLRQQMVAELNGDPCGAVRSELKNEITVLSWMMNPVFRGQGIGGLMVTKFAATIPGPIRAEMKTVNVPSARIAERAGLAFVCEIDGILRYERGPLG